MPQSETLVQGCSRRKKN